MLRYPLIHPPLLAALAAAGHGSRILIADGHFPCSTHANPAAAMIHLNLRANLLTGDQVLETLLDAVAVEHAVVMASDGPSVPAHEGYRTMLGDVVPFEAVERFAFYDLAKGADTAVVVATGDQRQYSNLLLTVGVVGVTPRKAS
ncbi:RbsD/FucU family protein [Glycomyces tritici]|uniref:RbsD/FucU family protein n=1 Tax=Glycomyces tritici TaxID=2665176 RepID=A0ABT7YUG6_9ACTN|nr:RbsD/FucU family protein [Glycomyces tritici]MDN3241503.1 RbsD/FucU family protein [Glycomyces tritici]MDN3242290.1 RbsD/FucU family protein [Glycomyces tritici]